MRQKATQILCNSRTLYTNQYRQLAGNWASDAGWQVRLFINYKQLSFFIEA